MVWFSKKKRNEEYKRTEGNGAVIVCNQCTILTAPLWGFPFAQASRIHLSGVFIPSSLWLGPLIRVMGSVPVPAELSGMRKFLSELSEGAASGRLVCVYPEGMIEPYCDHLRQFREEAFAVAVRADVPVVPLVLTERPQRGIWRFKKRPHASLWRSEPPFIPLPMESVEKTKSWRKELVLLWKKCRKRGGPQSRRLLQKLFAGGECGRKYRYIS